MDKKLLRICCIILLSLQALKTHKDKPGGSNCWGSRRYHCNNDKSNDKGSSSSSDKSSSESWGDKDKEEESEDEGEVASYEKETEASRSIDDGYSYEVDNSTGVS